MKKIFSCDVSIKELMSLYTSKSSKLKDVLYFLEEYLIGSDEDPSKSDRDKSIGTNVGSINVFLDDDGKLHLDFVTKFDLVSKDNIRFLESKKDEDK